MRIATQSAPSRAPASGSDARLKLQVRYPGVPIEFADSRKLAEDWTHRFLAAAFAQHAPLP